jgi:hypothetical protein
LIVIIMFAEEYKLWSSSLCTFSKFLLFNPSSLQIFSWFVYAQYSLQCRLTELLVESPLSVTIPSTPFSNTSSLCASHNVRYTLQSVFFSILHILLAFLHICYRVKSVDAELTHCIAGTYFLVMFAVPINASSCSCRSKWVLYLCGMLIVCRTSWFCRIREVRVKQVLLSTDANKNEALPETLSISFQ